MSFIISLSFGLSRNNDCNNNNNNSASGDTQQPTQMAEQGGRGGEADVNNVEDQAQNNNENEEASSSQQLMEEGSDSRGDGGSETTEAEKSGDDDKKGNAAAAASDANENDDEEKGRSSKASSASSNSAASDAEDEEIEILSAASTEVTDSEGSDSDEEEDEDYDPELDDMTMETEPGSSLKMTTSGKQMSIGGSYSSYEFIGSRNTFILDGTGNILTIRGSDNTVKYSGRNQQNTVVVANGKRNVIKDSEGKTESVAAREPRMLRSSTLSQLQNQQSNNVPTTPSNDSSVGDSGTGTPSLVAAVTAGIKRPSSEPTSMASAFKKLKAMFTLTRGSGSASQPSTEAPEDAPPSTTPTPTSSPMSLDTAAAASSSSLLETRGDDFDFSDEESSEYSESTQASSRSRSLPPLEPEPPRENPDITRQIINEQDRAYQESLQADQAKAEKKRLEEEEKQKKEDKKEAHKQFIIKAREEARNGLPVEPGTGEGDSAGSGSVIAVNFRLPNGEAIHRNFRSSDALSVVFQYVFSNPSAPETFDIFRRPSQVFQQGTEVYEQTLQELGFQAKELLLVRDVDENAEEKEVENNLMKNDDN